MTQAENSEWRRKATARTAAPFRGALGVHPAGSLVVTQTVGRLEDGRVVTFDAPSPVALALGAARDSCARAEALRVQLGFTKSKAHPFRGIELLHVEPATVVFDFLSSYMATVIFSFAALEYFANEVMERHSNTLIQLSTQSRARRGTKRRTKTIKLSAKSLERKPTDEKLSVILPQLLECPSPKGLNLWARYVQLRRLRNDVIHLKGQGVNPKVTSPNAIDTESPLLKFFSIDPSGHVATSVDMVGHFSGHIPWGQFDWLESFQLDPK